jgi:hypothetical protein
MWCFLHCKNKKRIQEVVSNHSILPTFENLCLAALASCSLSLFPQTAAATATVRRTEPNLLFKAILFSHKTIVGILPFLLHNIFIVFAAFVAKS